MKIQPTRQIIQDSQKYGIFGAPGKVDPRLIGDFPNFPTDAGGFSGVNLPI